MNLSYKLVNSPVGVLKLVASEKGLVAILWETTIRGVFGSAISLKNRIILCSFERKRN